MDGFRVVQRVGVSWTDLARALHGRAATADPLDPALAQLVLRAGLGVASCGVATFVYANVSECVVVLDGAAIAEAGAAFTAHNSVLAHFVGRLSRLTQGEISATSRVYEFPDEQVVRRALVGVIEEAEERTPERTWQWLAAQQADNAVPASLEAQTAYLHEHGVELDALPTWWWRGVAVHQTSQGFDVLDTTTMLDALERVPL